jgi:hypothetical protein
MPAYTPTGGANLLNAQGGLLSLRVTVAMLQVCQQKYGTASESDKGQITRILRNPAGYASQLLPLVVAVANVASPGTDTTPNAPTDAEITAALNTLWPVISTLGA